MEKKKLATILVGGALTLVTIFGAVTYQVVNAQASTPTPNTPATTTGSTQPGFGRGMREGGYSEQGLATALGISLADLQTAEQTATTEALKEAVSAGLITQSQADQFAQGAQNGQHLRGLPFLGNSTIDYDALLAKALGITTEKLQSARQTAYFATLDQALTDGNMTQAQVDAAKGNYILRNNTQFQSSLKSAYETAVKQAVTDGLITQAQADALLSQASSSNFGGWMGMGGPGGRGGHGGMGPGGPGGFDPNNGTAPNSSNNQSFTNPSSAPTTGNGA